ncbi:hypothetical protein AMECASPLE_005433 [Ameca splendens]|uniref:Uncharacterized protein n=1 Tax=Ameca splendens TaxID=208324 RepID=A0ABV0Z8E5_9TELE
MLVFDLERQNRSLCELFQQKLPNQPTAQYQVQTGPLPDYNAQLHNDSAKQVEPAQTEAQAKVIIKERSSTVLADTEKKTVGPQIPHVSVLPSDLCSIFS